MKVSFQNMLMGEAGENFCMFLEEKLGCEVSSYDVSFGKYA